jgi:hypothetical protein
MKINRSTFSKMVATNNLMPYFQARVRAIKCRPENRNIAGKAKIADVQRTQSGAANCRIYSEHARQNILRSVTELRDLVLEKRKGYILCSGTFSSYGHSNFMSDDDRKRFDVDSKIAMTQCSKLIRSLEAQINADETLSETEQNHLKGITFLLNIYLKDVCRLIAQLRAIHLKKAQNLQRICRLANLVNMFETGLVEMSNEEEAQKDKLSRLDHEIDARRDEERTHTDDKENEASEEGWTDAEDFSVEEKFDVRKNHEGLKTPTEEATSVRRRTATKQGSFRYLPLTLKISCRNVG